MVILDVLLLLHVPASSAVDEADDVFISRVAYDSFFLQAKKKKRWEYWAASEATRRH